MRERRIHMIALIVSVAVAATLIAAIVGPSVYFDRNPRALLEKKTAIQLPSESSVDILGESDGGFQNDYVTIYSILSTAATAGTDLAPERIPEPVQGELQNHLRDLTVIVTGNPTLDARRATYCKTLIPSTETDDYEAILCRTDNNSEWLVYETNN